MRTKGSLRLLTIVMMGLCIFYAVIAFQMPVGTKQVDPSVFAALSIVAGLGVLAGIVNALLTGPMLPPSTTKTRLIISLALMESAAVSGFVLRTMGLPASQLLAFFAVPVVCIGIFVLPRALTNPE